jgi:hypothetical protein
MLKRPLMSRKYVLMYVPEIVTTIGSAQRNITQRVVQPTAFAAWRTGHGPHRKYRVLCCCISICCLGNVFTVTLPSNERLYSFHYSGFEPYLPRRSVAFIPRGMGPVLLFLNCSLLGLIVSSAVVSYERASLNVFSATGDLQSSLQVPPWRFDRRSFQIYGRPRNPSLRGYPPPPAVLPTVPPRLHHTEHCSTSLLPFIQDDERGNVVT